MTDTTPPFAIVWDGDRRLAALPAGALAERTLLAAESAGGRVKLLAAREAGETGPLAAELPPGTRLVHFARTGSAEIVLSATLDGGFLPAPGGSTRDGEAVSVARDENGRLRLATTGDGLASGLNLSGLTESGLWRCVVGPFADAAGHAARIVTMSVAIDGAAPVLQFDGPPDCLALVRIAGDGGLHRAMPVANAAGSAFEAPNLPQGEVLLVVAGGGRRLRFDTGSDAPSAEALLLLGDGHGWRVQAVGRGERPSLATGLARSGIAAASEFHGIEPDRLAAATHLAKAALADCPPPSAGDAFAAALVEAIASAPQPRRVEDEEIADEIGPRPLADQLLIERWAGIAPNALGRALALRMLPSVDHHDGDALATLVRWYGQPSLPGRLARAAALLTTTDPTRARALQDLAGGWRRSWATAEDVGEARRLLDASGLARAVPALDALMAGFGDTGQPQGESDLETLARQRSELVDAARATGQPDDVLAELGQRLASLRPAEIALLHAGFARLRRREARREAAVRLVASWEKAAGRQGSPLRPGSGPDGLDRALALGGRAASLAESLPVEALGRAVTAIVAATGTSLGAATDEPEDAATRRSLIGYGCLLLADLVRREADAVFAASALPAQAGTARARAGADATLGAYLARAEAAGGRERIWGAPFLTARTEPAA